MSPPRKLKRKLEEELESTAESHPMSLSKRPRVDDMDMCTPQVLCFTPEMTAHIIWQLVKAKSYMSHYDNQALKWEDETLWQMIINSLNLQMKISVEDFKVTVLHYYQIFKKDANMSELNLLATFLGKSTMEFVHQCFKMRRENVGEYLSSCFCSPPTFAMELYQESSLTRVSHGPGSSGVILPLQSETSYYTKFAESLQQIEKKLIDEELLWAQYQMTKYAGQISLFCAKSPPERIDFVKKGYVRKTMKK